MTDPLTPYGNKPMVTPIVNAVNYEYKDFEVLRKITDGEIDGYTYHRDDNPMPSARRLSFGVKENTVRLSVGIEPTGQIIEDIKQALQNSVSSECLER